VAVVEAPGRRLLPCALLGELFGYTRGGLLRCTLPGQLRGLFLGVLGCPPRRLLRGLLRCLFRGLTCGLFSLQSCGMLDGLLRRKLCGLLRLALGGQFCFKCSLLRGQLD